MKHSTNLHSNSLFSILFRYRVVKILILLLLHIIGALILGIFFFAAGEYILGSVGILGGRFMQNLWNSLTINLLPPLILLLSIIVITVSNPIYALVSLILIFFSTALFLISIHVEFLALIYIIIYIGAIAILFLFVLMMFNLKELRDSSLNSWNKDFLIISFSFYLFLFYKIYYLLLNVFLYYIEYDVYINEVINLKYSLLFSQSRNIYINFIHDLAIDLAQAILEWRTLGVDPYKICNSLEYNHSVTKNDILPKIYTWYLEKNNILEDIPQILNSESSVKFSIENITSLFFTLYQTPTDILICGQVLYTYYSYLFLLVTIILFIAMIGAIILALSTTEKNVLEVTNNN